MPFSLNCPPFSIKNLEVDGYDVDEGAGSKTGAYCGRFSAVSL